VDSDIKGFFAYSSEPTSVGEIVNTAIERLRLRSFPGEIHPWKDLDIAGRFIVDGVLERIDTSNPIIADISCLNFNVTYEAGYAIGKQNDLAPEKRIPC